MHSFCLFAKLVRVIVSGFFRVLNQASDKTEDNYDSSGCALLYFKAAEDCYY